MKLSTLLRSTVAAALGAILLTPGIGAAVCAMGTDCATTPAPVEAETTGHCAAMAPTALPETSETPAKDHPPQLECCLEPATLGDPVAALSRSTGSNELRPTVDCSPNHLRQRPPDLSGTPAARPSPTERSSPPPAGVELRTLHQSFLS